jgi:hypothetical protein
VYVLFAAHVPEAPGARPPAGGAGQVTAPSVGSLTLTDDSGTLPLFVTVYV